MDNTEVIVANPVGKKDIKYPVIQKLTDKLSFITLLGFNPFWILLSVVSALGFFYYGISLPFQFRFRGDAWQYMDIASQFTSFKDVLHYAGMKSPGMPWFDYLFLYFDNSGTFSRVNHICITLFILHEITLLLLCIFCVKYKLFEKRSTYFGVLFLILAAYPAMVMHTTTPLSDVLGMDILLVALGLFSVAMDVKKHNFLIVLSVMSGALLGYAILLRTAYYIGILGFLLIFALTTIRNNILVPSLKFRQSLMVWFLVILSLAAVMVPVLYNYKVKYNAICLQDPVVGTPTLTRYLQTGLIGARTVWSIPPSQVSPDEVSPTYPDEFLVKNFYNRCNITSFVGSTETSLLGCFYQAPYLVPIYLVKKVIGLFDTFRMTPYTELITPSWYKWVSRLFSSIAFVGFWVFLWDGMVAASQFLIYRRSVSALFAAVWGFCMILVVQHALISVEERYAFPWIPFCLIAVLLKIKDLSEKNDSFKVRCKYLIFAIFAITLYFSQVLAWDKAMRGLIP